eukprot:CAMPEP_0194122464 /NCGR_PEP_ID=MMETSP0150-20130528/50800_1 /TAXON_ID=122233 /ORGANISM="Chaetoceros debilis, Strain MM31A-1" /LENGTH=59 /DNA_ID=CAMNT_0038815347 /DNA_START=203 /DNA_END=379 /DNA_ORIENTATION=+
MSKQLSSYDPGPMPSSSNATAEELIQWLKDMKEFEKLVAKKSRDKTLARMFINASRQKE